MSEKLQDHEAGWPQQSYWATSRAPGRSDAFVVLRRWRGDRASVPAVKLTAPRTAQAHSRAVRSTASSARARPAHPDVRRRIAAGVGVVLLIVIVLVVNGCLKSQQKQSLEPTTTK